MNDTKPDIRDRYRRMLMRRSGAERVEMACRMFDAARMLVRAGLGDPDGVDRSAEMRVRLFLRTYGSDFDEETKERIVNRLRAEGGTRREHRAQTTDYRRLL